MADRTKITIALSLAALFFVMALTVPNGTSFVVLGVICLAVVGGVATAGPEES